jgi:hypothetical protein
MIFFPVRSIEGARRFVPAAGGFDGVRAAGTVGFAMRFTEVDEADRPTPATIHISRALTRNQ